MDDAVHRLSRFDLSSTALLRLDGELRVLAARAASPLTESVGIPETADL